MMAPETFLMSSKELAESVGLLGEAIYKIQLSWTRPEELKQAQLCIMVPTQRVKISQGGAHLGVSQGHGAYGHLQSGCPLVLCKLHLLSLVQEGGAE